MRSAKIWDLPTQIFHWCLVASIILAYITGSGRLRCLQIALHLSGSYGVVLLLALRLPCGVFDGTILPLVLPHADEVIE